MFGSVDGMGYLVIDVESTTKNKGHPFTPSNKLCLVGAGNETFKIQYDEEPFGEALAKIQSLIDQADVLVGFNIKFDLHWLRRYGIVFRPTHRVHDCQLAYFLAVRQSNRYPSLDEACEFYGLPAKLDRVKEYWDAGVDTDQIPLDILDPYLRQDLDLTEQMYLMQLELFAENPQLYKLFELQCEDLLVLEEMEWNGLPYDKKQSLERAAEVDARVAAITDTLHQIVGIPAINWNSGDHLSAVLYGGTVPEVVKEQYLFTYKDPKKEPVWKTKNTIIQHQLPTLLKPLPNTSLQKDGVYQTGTPILMQLKSSATGSAGKIIECLLELAELTKLNDYYRGIPELIDEMEWGEDDVLHGNLNQCAVVTGRLSSNKPNQQNMPDVVHELIRSRYA